jgi:hypothetical protein
MRELSLKKNLCNIKMSLMQSLFVICLGISVLCSGPATAEPNYVSFGRDSVVALMQKTVETKMLPAVIKGEGLIITVTKLLQFSMDWEKSQFFFRCGFTVEPQKYGIVKESGEIALTGMGLLALSEQKMGVKVINVTGFKLNGPLGGFNEGLKIVIDKSMSGKEYWYGKAPLSSEKLTKDNFAAMLRVAITQQLPWTGKTEKTSLTFLALHEFAVLPEPGKLYAGFDMKGTKKGLFYHNFSGTVGVNVDVRLAPEDLAGIIRIEKITSLQLDGTPRFLAPIVRGLVNIKLKGEEIPFSWK